jgi:hypothetical protein
MRWKFPIPATPAEARERAETLRAIDAWWRLFSDSADAIDAMFFQERRVRPRPVHAGWLGRAAREAVLGIRAGTGQRRAPTHLHARGDRSLRPLVDELTARAPRLARWEFYGYRLPEPADLALKTAAAICRRQSVPPMPLIAVQLVPGNRIDLTLQAARSALESEEGLGHFHFRAVEQLVGEELLDKWIGYIGPAEEDEAIAARAGGSVVPAARLKGTVDAVIAAARDQLPPQPRHATAARVKSEGEWISYSLAPPDEAADDFAAGMTSTSA